MTNLNEQFVVDKKGRRIGVVLNIAVYRKILDQLDELDAIRTFDAAKASGEAAVPLEQVALQVAKRRR